jgi:transcriptional regulator with XRE-family HTH domain
MPRKRPLTREEISARRAEVTRKAFRGELRFPEALREIRQALGLTQDEFAERFGLTRARVIELEKGRANPTIETLDKICRPFGFVVGFVPREGASRPPPEFLDPLQKPTP